MKIQTRLFLIIGTLVLAVVALQLWLHQRQLRAMEKGLGAVAGSVGRDLMAWHFDGLVEFTGEADVFVHDVDHDLGAPSMKVFVVPEPDAEATSDTEDPAQPTEVRRFAVEHRIEVRSDGEPGAVTEHRSIRLEVVDDGEHSAEPVLLVADDTGETTRIPIPTAPTAASVQDTMRQGLVFSGGLLVAGLVASAVVAHRLGRPLNELSRQAERLGEGEFGIRVPVTTGGEVGELQAAFDQLSLRLADLEREREQWRRREHLAQLGDLARGLAHTVRNPLHTLGLAVEELAGEAAPDDDRVETARAQIRRVDRWVCSFLAIGAGNAAEPAPVVVAPVVEDAVLEAVQQGANVEVVGTDSSATVLGVAAGLRAAIGNLLENAVQSAPDEAVDVAISADDDRVRIAIRDRGPGLPEAVRERLFSPHVTDRPGGAGMGLYLAQRLVTDVHGGTLELSDAEDGGTLAVIELPRGEPKA
jgi:signal transduction histidine kinase